jgi:hypothetical protein
MDLNHELGSRRPPRRSCGLVVSSAALALASSSCTHRVAVARIDEARGLVVEPTAARGDDVVIPAVTTTEAAQTIEVGPGYAVEALIEEVEGHERRADIQRLRCPCRLTLDADLNVVMSGIVRSRDDVVGDPVRDVQRYSVDQVRDIGVTGRHRRATVALVVSLSLIGAAALSGLIALGVELMEALSHIDDAIVDIAGDLVVDAFGGEEEEE